MPLHQHLPGIIFKVGIFFKKIQKCNQLISGYATGCHMSCICQQFLFRLAQDYAQVLFLTLMGAGNKLSNLGLITFTINR